MESPATSVSPGQHADGQSRKPETATFGSGASISSVRWLGKRSSPSAMSATLHVTLVTACETSTRRCHLTDSDIQANRPFPRFFDPATPERGIQNLSTIRFIDTFQNAFHHGFQAKLEKRYSAGAHVRFGLYVVEDARRWRGRREPGGADSESALPVGLAATAVDSSTTSVKQWSRTSFGRCRATICRVRSSISSGVGSRTASCPYVPGSRCRFRGRQGDLNVVEENIRPGSDRSAGV